MKLDPPGSSDGSAELRHRLLVRLLRWLIETSGNDPADTEAFRTYLMRNLPEPGVVPGGTAVVAMTDIAGVVGTSAGPVGSFLKAIAAAVNVPAGYEVTYRDISALPEVPDAGSTDPAIATSPGAASPAAAATPKPPVITVRIREVRSNRLLDQKVCRAKDRDTVLRSGAYWAAARVIESSRCVPPWARWDSATSSTLATFFLAEDQPSDDLEALRLAACKAPTSGLLALELSQREATEGDELGAFLNALRAVTIYPRYLNARYRLGVSAGLLAGELSEDPTGVDRVEHRAKGRGSNRHHAGPLRAAGHRPAWMMLRRRHRKEDREVRRRLRLAARALATVEPSGASGSSSC